jgi:phosphate transport system permease protein
VTVIDLTTSNEPAIADDGISIVDSPISEAPIRIRKFDRDSANTYCGAAMAALAVTWLVYTRLTPFSGGLGFVVVAWGLFGVFVYALARQQWGRIAALDHLVRFFVASAALLALIPLGSIVFSVAVKGYHGLQASFLTKTLAAAGSQDKFQAGGAWHAIVGTLEVVGISLLISVPLGIMTAVFLNEVGGRLARPVRMFTDAMSAVPSIVAGLFVYAVLIQPGVLDATGFAGALSLSILMLPTVTRTAEVILRLVPGGLREASLALGGSEWNTTRQVVLPTARTGLVTAVVLGVARVVGETAPLIVTMIGAQQFNKNPFSGLQDALPLFIWSQKLKSTGSGVVEQWMWSGACVLLAIVLVLFVTARVLTNRSGLSRRR